MAVSEDVWHLVRTVERLPGEEQRKILRMVDLLALVPPAAQSRTQRMLRELLERAPGTKRECVAGLDDVLAYLESQASQREHSNVVTCVDFTVGKVRAL